MTETINICSEHKLQYMNEYIMSPKRWKCNLCNEKNVHGYSNPDHVSNPFGYLYLIPVICNDCANNNKLCIWCQMK